MKRYFTYPHDWVTLLMLSIAPGCLLSCSGQKQDSYPEWLSEYDATFVLPGELHPPDYPIPPCTCYLSPDGKPIIWVKTQHPRGTTASLADFLEMNHNSKEAP